MVKTHGAREAVCSRSGRKKKKKEMFLLMTPPTVATAQKSLPDGFMREIQFERDV